MRLRRLRKDEVTRDLVNETQLLPKDLIMPYFVIEGKKRKDPIGSMPGVYRVSVDNLIRDIEELRDLGIKAVLLFGVSDKKDLKGSEAYRKNSMVQKALRAMKRNVRNVVAITDVCLCGYTSHGHCGIVKTQNSPPLLNSFGGSAEAQSAKAEKLKTQNYFIDNDKTLKVLAKIALSHAEAGADFVAPSAMMDGQVKAIRETLDKNSFEDVGILAYSAKYASNFYGPFREALDSKPQFGDRRSYQMDYRNSDEALKEIKGDIDEGADIVMVKPALAYLDIIQRAKDKFDIPIAAYNVSGEYAMVKNYLCRTSYIVHRTSLEREMVLEILTSIKRAGADLIITYHAKEAARWLR